jgi:hypothetical protein
VTATSVQYVLDELGTVVDAQPDDHPLKRVDRDNTLLYDGSGTFDLDQSVDKLTNDLKKANYVGARYGAPSRSYIGTNPDLDYQEVVGVRIVGYSGSYGHVDPLGEDGVVFQGRDDSLVQQCIDALLDGLQFPDAGRTDVAFTHLTIANDGPASAEFADHHLYGFDVLFDGFENL